MQALKLKVKPAFILFLFLLNGYGLTNLLTGGIYCQHFRLNSSKSLPFTLFTVSPIESLERNMFVSLSHPFSHQDLFKQIVGLPGDHIAIHHQHVWINGQDYGYLYDISPSGLSLSPICEGMISEGFVFVHAIHPQSFDSRYAEFGLVAKEQLKERLWPIF
jgi:conjugal transfer pilin signal peptidase TrbI